MYLLLNLASLHANVSGHLIPSQTASNKWCQDLGSLSADVSKGGPPLLWTHQRESLLRMVVRPINLTVLYFSVVHAGCGNTRRENDERLVPCTHIK